MVIWHDQSCKYISMEVMDKLSLPKLIGLADGQVNSSMYGDTIDMCCNTIKRASV